MARGSARISDGDGVVWLDLRGKCCRWKFGDLGIWGFGNLGIWGFENLRILEFGDLGI